MTLDDEIRQVVQERYARIARTGASCCGEPRPSASPGELAGLGCGDPVSLAELHEGERVVDLGAGGGLDVFRAAEQVGPSGRVLGVDMTPEMLARARAGAERRGLGWVEFRQGSIEALPVSDAWADVVLSNCVINLAPNKRAVFADALRVLRPGGRLIVADVVAVGPLPPSLREDANAWAACVGGAVPEAEYLELLRAAGFADVEVLARQGPGGGPVRSLTVRGYKPAPGEGQPMDATTLAREQQELVAIGAAVAANCEPCLQYHVEKGRRAGLSASQLRAAVDVARTVKEVPARRILERADELLAPTEPAAAEKPRAGCCG